MTLEVITAATLTLLSAVFLVQLVAAAYIQGVARTAADEGVRAGSRVAAGPPVCQARAADVFGSLLPGPLGSTVEISCRDEAGHLVSEVRVTFDSPTAGMPTLHITATGRATQETSG